MIITSVLVLFFQLLEYTISVQNLKIILIKDDLRTDVVDWFKEELDELNSKSTVLNFSPIIIERNDEDPKFDIEISVCDAISNGGIAIIDTAPFSTHMYPVSTIPYSRLYVTIKPFLDILDEYLIIRNGTDVVEIFENPDKADEALYSWLDSASRVLRLAISEGLDDISVNRLKRIRPIPHNFALIGETRNINKLLETALNQNLIKLPDRWNILFLDFKMDEFNVTMIEGLPVNLLYIKPDICCLFLEEINCQCPEGFSLQKQFFKLFPQIISKAAHDFISKNSEFPELKCNQEGKNQELMSDFNEIFNTEIKSNNIIKHNGKVYVPNFNASIEVGQNQTFKKIATFDYINGIKTVQGEEIPTISKYYRIGVTHAIPWSFKETDENGNTYWTGYCIDFAKKLSTMINFTFDFVEPKHGDFGKKKNGKFDGIVGDLVSGETDFAITALIMTAQREEVIDFVAPYFEQTGITIGTNRLMNNNITAHFFQVMRKPVRKTSLFKFMTVLKLEVWMSILGALILTAIMVWFLDKYSPYSAQNNKKAYPYPCRKFTLKESFWFALTSFTPQGGGEAPKSLSGRTLVAAYWLFVVLMLATFTANLAAFLTVERMQTPVQSLDQLAKQSRINYTVVSESGTHLYFINMKHAEDTLYRMWKELTLNTSTDDSQYRVWDYPIKEQYGHILLSINDSNPVVSAEEGFRTVNDRINADFAFIHDSSEIQYEISRNCNLTQVGDIFAEKPYAIAVQQGSHLQDDFSKAILDLQQLRFFEQLRAKYWNNSNRGVCDDADESEGITLESLGGVFIATLFGLGLAMITLVGEVFYYRKKRKDKQQLKDNIKKVTNDKIQPITIGSEFKPAKFTNKTAIGLEDVTLYPRSRNRLTLIN